MMSTRPAGPTFREGDESRSGPRHLPGHVGRFSPAERGRQLGRHYGAQRRRPQPPGDMAGSFRERDPGFRELTPP